MKRDQLISNSASFKKATTALQKTSNAKIMKLFLDVVCMRTLRRKTLQRATDVQTDGQTDRKLDRS